MKKRPQYLIASLSFFIAFSWIGERLSFGQSQSLTIGAKAPKLEAARWNPKSDSSLSQEIPFSSGKVFVIDFWASWCGPCIAAMPHLASLQSKYGDSTLTTICVTDDDWETVSSLLKSPRMSQDEVTADSPPQNSTVNTLAEMLANTIILVDTERKTQADYLDAAGINSIPTTFIVGKTGLIEWIGHPMELDKPLAEVVNDKWDRDEFAKGRAKRSEMNMLLQSAMQLAMSGQTARAKEILSKFSKETDDDQIQSQIRLFLEMIGSRGSREADSVKYYRERLEFLRGKPRELTDFSRWLVRSIDREPGLRDLIEETVQALESEIASLPSKDTTSLWHTVAILQKAQGNFAEAIVSQSKCLESSNDSAKPLMQSFLKELQKIHEDNSTKEPNPPSQVPSPLEV